MFERRPQNLCNHLLIFFTSLAVPAVLFFFRHHDDNRLTSWKWAFDSERFERFLIIVLVALLMAWFASRVSIRIKAKPLMLFILSFTLASCFWSEPEVIVDAARYFTQAKHLKVYGTGFFAEQWGKSIFAWTDLPLVPFLDGILFRLFGEHRLVVQILNSVFYSLTVVLTYQLGRALWDEDVGLWGGLLLLGFPYLYTQVPLMLVDVPTMFFFMLAVVSCTSALQKGGRARIVAAAISLFLIFYVKYSGWVLLSVIPVLFVCFLLQNPAATIRRGGALALLACLFIGVLFFLYREVFVAQIRFLLEFQKPGLNRWSESYASTFLFQIHPYITVAALFSLVVAVSKKDFKFLIVSFLVLLFLFMQVKRIRYTLPVFPMLALMAAYGFRELQNRNLLKHLVFSLVATSFAVAFSGFLPLLKGLGVQNLQGAGRYLDSLPAADAEVFAFAGENAVVNPDLGVPVLDIYTAKKLSYEKKPIEPSVLERTQNSSLRFTWEYPMPQYYNPGQRQKDADALVVITDTPGYTNPALEGKTAGYPFSKTFQQSSNIFQHQTFVTVYHK